MFFFLFGDQFNRFPHHSVNYNNLNRIHMSIKNIQSVYIDRAVKV